MFRRTFVLQVLCLAFMGQLCAQDLDESNFIRYTRLQGLSNNYVSGIVQDSAGYIWIATHKGLNRFDGKSFQPVFKSSSHSPLPDNLLVSMHHQTCSEVIGATRAGAFAFNPATGQYRQFIIPCDSSIFFWTNHALDIVQDWQGNYIVSTKTGLYVFDRVGRLVRRYDHHTARDAGSQELIFGGWVHLLGDSSTLQQNGLLGSRYDPRANRIDTHYVAKRDYLKRQITDSFGDMRPSWCGRSGELIILNLDKNSLDVADLYTPRGRPNIMPFNVKTELGWASALSYINDSLLILTGKSSGFYLLHYDVRTREICCDGKKYFEGNVCTSIFQDKEERLWIGTADGLYKQNLHNSFFSVTDLSRQAPYLLGHEIRCIYAEDSIIFAGLNKEGGLLVLNKKEGTIRKTLLFGPAGAYSNTIACIFSYDKDTLWLGTLQGIVWLNKKNYHYGRIHTPAPFQWIQKEYTNRIFTDSKGNAWITVGKLNTVILFDRRSRTFLEISPLHNPLLKITYVFSMAEDLQGNIWLAGDGLCRWNVSRQVVDTLIPYPRVSKLLRNYMFILDRDANNNLWLSSFDNEIIQYNCTTNTMYLRQQENNFIDGNTVTSSPIIHNNIWMGTDNGISAFNIGDYSVKQFTYADGLPSVAITTYRKASFYDSVANRFYLGARHRLISLTPDVTLSHKVAPVLFIEKISVRDSLIQPVGRDIRLRYSQNNITIIFNTINFTDPEENRFAWRTVNNSEHDTSWNELNDQTSLTLTNLSGGWHSVQVRLFSANNRWPQQVKTITIYIQPPFWQTAWFLILIAACIAGSIVLIYKRRVNAVRKKERDRAQVQQLIAEEYKNRLELEQIINYFSYSLSDKTTVDEVLWDITGNLISRFCYSDCVIYLWNADRTRMVQRAAYGAKGSPAVIAAHAFEVRPGQGLVGWVMQTKEALVVADTSRDHRYRVDDQSRLSEIVIPIIHNNELIGIIDSEHPEPNFYQERDMNILTTVANLVANKIRQIESDQTLKVKQDEITNINGQLAEAQLLALQTQMNPHFIFNSLNSIKGMILENQQQRASRYLSKFAQMIRLTMDQSKEIFASLHENKEYLESYLEMEKLRFDNSFTFQILVDEDIEEDDEDIMIPTLMIQPLAENAIWHGLLHLKGEKKLSIRFSRQENAIICSIEDNGIGILESERLKQFNKTPHKSVGLDNLRNRIKVMNEKYNARCELRITDLGSTDKNRTGTRVVLSFNVITALSYS
jgi:ligand-binding sensor domain-containing protein/putative methionine-R-sulfoxide reductase with GAF domain